MSLLTVEEERPYCQTTIHHTDVGGYGIGMDARDILPFRRTGK